VKRPDVVWHCRDGQVIAVEVELTSKRSGDCAAICDYPAHRGEFILWVGMWVK
jgi:hypothetical protein